MITSTAGDYVPTLCSRRRPPKSLTPHCVYGELERPVVDLILGRDGCAFTPAHGESTFERQPGISEFTSRGLLSSVTGPGWANRAERGLKRKYCVDDQCPCDGASHSRRLPGVTAVPSPFLDYRLRSWRRSSLGATEAVPDIHVRCVTVCGRSLYSGVPCVCLIVEDERRSRRLFVTALEAGALRGSQSRSAVRKGFFLVNHESFDLVIARSHAAARATASRSSPTLRKRGRPDARADPDRQGHRGRSGARTRQRRRRLPRQAVRVPELLARIRALLAARPRRIRSCGCSRTT